MSFGWIIEIFRAIVLWESCFCDVDIILLCIVNVHRKIIMLMRGSGHKKIKINNKDIKIKKENIMSWNYLTHWILYLNIDVKNKLNSSPSKFVL